MADLEVLAHEQVERGAGMGADGADAAATVSQKPQAEVGTKLGVFLEKQLRELPPGPRERLFSPFLVLPSPHLQYRVSLGSSAILELTL